MKKNKEIKFTKIPNLKFSKSQGQASLFTEEMVEFCKDEWSYDVHKLKYSSQKTFLT